VGGRLFLIYHHYGEGWLSMIFQTPTNLKVDTIAHECLTTSEFDNDFLLESVDLLVDTISKKHI